MSLPRFLNRIVDAAGPLMPGLERSEIGQRLEHMTVGLRIDSATAVVPGHAAGYLHAVNLAARLYPHLALDAPPALQTEAVELACAIHPHIDVHEPGSRADVELLWQPATATASAITVACDGWLVQIDHDQPVHGATSGAVAMLAAALAMAQVFRAVFAKELDRGRAEAIPWSLHLVTLAPEGPDLPLPQPLDIGTVHLVGCGAIGQAAAAALGELPVTGTLVAVDPDPVDVGNLQRYVLTHDVDEGADKPALIARAFEGTGITVSPVTTRWGVNERSGVGTGTALVALDSPEDRIDVQASLPHTIYNAWTRADDVGVSRHECFGDEPCLACLYWPRQPRPSQSQRIADELGEPELRVLCYLAGRVPAGRPLQPQELVASLRLPQLPESPAWLERSILDDVAQRAGIDPNELARYRELTVDFLHRDGVCGELLRRSGHTDERRQETVAVPLAHQSALAGGLLAITFFVARTAELAEHRPSMTQARYDVLSPNPQLLPLPSSRREHCLCRDPDFLTAYTERWSERS